MQLRGRKISSVNANPNPNPPPKKLPPAPKEPTGVQTRKTATITAASKKNPKPKPKPKPKPNRPKKAPAPAPKTNKEKGGKRAAVAAVTAPKEAKAKGKAKAKAKVTPADEEHHEEDEAHQPATPQHHSPDPNPEADTAIALAQAALTHLQEPSPTQPLPTTRKRPRADSTIAGPSPRPEKASKRATTTRQPPPPPRIPPFGVQIRPPRHSHDPSQSSTTTTTRHQNPQKWGRHTLPPFGTPVWRRDRATEAPVLLLPIAITVEEEVRAMRELADADPERYEEEFHDFVRGLREEDYRGLHDGFVGRILDEFDEEEERRRREAGLREIEIDEDYDDDDSTSGSNDNEGGHQNGEDGPKDREKHNEPENQNESEQQDEPERQNESDEQENQNAPNTSDHRGSKIQSALPQPGPSGSKEKPSKSPGNRPLMTPPPPSPSPAPSLRANQPANVEPESFYRPSGSEKFDPEHPLYKPMPYDVSNDRTTRGPVYPGDEKRLERDAAEFIRSDHGGYEVGWVGRKFLGQGASGRAGMWEKKDADGTVVDRVCIKQIQERTYSKYDWNKPFEVQVMEDLQDEENNGTVQLRGYSRYPRSRAHRIYMEYCEHGDLERLISRYRSKRYVVDCRFKPSEQSTYLGRQYIPEEFIWDAFYHLANACRALDQGPKRRPKDERRNLYIHRDVKPENIFLAAPGGYGQNCAPIYPRTKLGDFGLTDVTGVDDPLNPSAYKGAGTIGYRPPEQKFPAHIQKDQSYYKFRDDFVYEEITNDEPKFGSGSNIWGVGVCIYKLIWLTDASYDFYVKMKEDGEVIPKIQTTRIPEYSQELRDLVHECLNFSPLKRPALNDLITRVGQARARFMEQWKETQEIPSESLLCYTDEALKEMEFGTWIKRRYVHEDALPPGYPDLSDPPADPAFNEDLWEDVTVLFGKF
ncbi:MAG: hypothetical protein Q9216_006677 [Gyalolechia sp. 2 TL-2023]